MNRGARSWILLVGLLGGFFLLGWPFKVQADIPRKIHYQGRITKTNNGPIAPGTYRFTFRIYDSETGGTPLWTETQTVEIDPTGYFSLNLGEVTPLDLDFTKPYWLSVEVNDDGEMSPRLPLLSVGYSINSDELDGLDSLQFLRSDVDDVMEANLTVQGTTTLQSSLVFDGPSADITSPSGENIRISPGDNANLIVDISAGNSRFKIVNGSLTIMDVDENGNVTISGADSTKVVQIHPGNLLVGDSAPAGFFNGGDVYITGDLHVDGSVNFSSSSTGGDALTIDTDNAEALLIRKDNDNGDVFVVNTVNSLVEVSSGTGNSPATRQSILLQHDGTNGTITTNSGQLLLSSDAGVVGINSNLQVQGQSQLISNGATTLVIHRSDSGTALDVSSGQSQFGDDVRIGSGSFNNPSTDEDLYVAGNLEVDGSTWLGDATADELHVTGGLYFEGDLDMRNHKIINIGSESSYFTDAGGLILNADLTLSGTASQILLQNAINLDLVNSTQNALSIESGLMSFDTQNARIGINTTTPYYVLDVHGGVMQVVAEPLTAGEQLILRQLNNGGYLYLGYDDGADIGRLGAGDASAGWTAKPLVLQPAGGNVGVGNTNPIARLDVTGTFACSDSASVGGDLAVVGSATVGTDSSPSRVTVKGPSSSGEYALMIYVGSDLAAWVRKK